MDGVTAFCEFFTEFRTNDAAAAVGWINRDTDVHLLKFGLWSLGFGLGVLSEVCL